MQCLEKSGYDYWGFKTLRTKCYLAWLKFSTMQAQRYIALQFEKQRKTSLVAIGLPYTSMVECDALENEILMSHSHLPPFSQMPFPRKHFRIRHSDARWHLSLQSRRKIRGRVRPLTWGLWKCACCSDHQPRVTMTSTPFMAQLWPKNPSKQGTRKIAVITE
jgi:hypothetical protein